MKKLLALVALAFAPLAMGACVVSGGGYFADQTDPNCFPTLDEAKCGHYQIMNGKTVGAVNIDVEDAKKYGRKVMNYANNRACEDKQNCGPYTLQFQAKAECDGKVVENMPGGEYRGLTANKARQILEFSNRQLEQAASAGEERGKNGKGKGKGKLWGND